MAGYGPRRARGARCRRSRRLAAHGCWPSGFLDARAALGSRFAARFPGINAACRAAGIDPATAPIPIRPAAHYHMGGIAVDPTGRSSLEGLWACGEAASTGLHGANRLASNSLLEAFVHAGIVAESVSGASAGAVGRAAPRDPRAPPPDARRVRAILSRCVGLERDRAHLLHAIDELRLLAFDAGPGADPALVGLFIAVAALARNESRGAHYRTDYPQKSSSQARRQNFDLDAVAALAEEACDAPATLATGD